MAWEHYEILLRGVGAWNEWRKTLGGETPELKGATLIDLDLRGANFRDANLFAADLTGARLNGANFGDARLTGANLTRTDFGGADLIGAYLDRAYLNGTDFTGVRLGFTSFEANNLSRVRGLETATHVRGSWVSIDTIYRSGGNIPEIFLRGCGVPEGFITYMRSLTSHPIQFYSCFISYSSKDQDFAERLHADLQNKGVRCWFAPEDLKIGDRFRDRIDESIRLHDKLLLILSENSVSSPWVCEEVEAAIEREHREGRTVLFPVKIDEAVMESEQAWAAAVRRTRHVGDFTCWKDHDSYRKAFDRLMRDLRAGEKKS